MLEPETRHLLLDALRPPPGYALGLAFGTTYSLDLLALITAPAAFAMFDRQRDDGSPVEDPIATLQALREYAARITLFCQAGQIAVPPDYRALLVYLEDSVHPVVPPRPEAIFHPKVWYLRFRHGDGGEDAYRLLCLSRNLTFDRSWDTMLRLEGRPGDRHDQPELARFAESLIAMADPVRPVPPNRVDEIRELGRQFAGAEWTLPPGFDRVRFWPLGDDGVERWPFEGKRGRMLVISPFVTVGALGRLTKGQRGSILISRPETLDALGGAATKHLAERLVLSPDASAYEAGQAVPSRAEAVAESVGHRLDGLHAKTYIADAGWRARVWTGSANATDAAFHGNVEFLVELEGRYDRCGVHAAIGDHTDRLGLRKLVAPYDPPPETKPPTEAELVEQRFDLARRAIGGLRYVATCVPVDADRWVLDLRGAPVVPGWDDALAGIAVTILPLTLGKGVAGAPALGSSGLRASFTVSEAAITPYYAVTLTNEAVEVCCLVVAELVDPPPGRSERVLAQMLANRADLIRFLLLLLGNVEDALTVVPVDGSKGGHGGWLTGFGSEALLEPLVRAFARDPARLRDIERVIAELSQNPEADKILPEGWNEIWEPIAAALAENRAR